VTTAAPVEASVAVAAVVAAPAIEAAAEIRAPKVETFVPTHPREVAPEPAAAWRPEPAPTAPPPTPAPKVDLDTALRDSGLVLIETKTDRVQPVVSEVEEPQVPRPRRERRPPPPDLNAPLMQVETHPKSDGDAPPR